MLATLYICAQDGHVPIIECSIYAVKEIVRAATVTLLFKRLSKLTIIFLLEGIEWLLNIIPLNGRDSINTSPAILLEGRSPPPGDWKRIEHNIDHMLWCTQAPQMI